MSEFKMFAKEAKKRLKNGFWSKVEEEKAEVIEEARRNGKNLATVEEAYKKKVETQIKDMASEKNTNDDEMFYKKVCKIMEAKVFVSNPLSQLIDHSVYDELDERGKQNYILKLSQRYGEMKKKYRIEHDLEVDVAF